MSWFQHITKILCLNVVLFNFGCYATEYDNVFEVEENSPIGTLVGKIQGEYQYTIIGDSFDQNFRLDSHNGEIKTKRTIDREEEDTYTFKAISPYSRHILSIKIIVLDMNDNSPIFSQNEFILNVPENIQVKSKRRLVSAIDADKNEYAVKKYSIISGNIGNSFSLSYQLSGVLVLDLVVDKALDRETIENYSLLIRAEDGGRPPNFSLLVVNVTVLDINDNSPHFSKQRYFSSIPHDLELNSRILSVSATDKDKGINGQIVYHINRHQSDESQVFVINKNSGLITLNKPLNFERNETHEIVVVARDKGEVPNETTAFVTVLIKSHTQIEQDAIVLSVAENTSIGTVFGRITQYKIDIESLPYSDEFEFFSNNTGLYIKTKQTLDYEIKSFYQFFLGSTTINIDIIDKNDNFPIFKDGPYSVSMDEWQKLGSSIITVTADDADRGENGRISYSLKNSSNLFIINEVSGLIVTNSERFDCKKTNPVELIVLATDNGENVKHSSSTTVTISFNGNVPVFDQLFYTASLAENRIPGSCFLEVQATDLDCGTNSGIHYSIEETEFDTFYINISTGMICLVGRLDYETRSYYSFTVIATNNGGLSTNAKVAIRVTDINDNIPEFHPSMYKARIDPSFFLNEAVIVTVMAHDDDFGQAGRIKYVIIKGNERNYFFINERSGIVTIKQKLPVGTFHLTVEALDGYNRRSKYPATLQIEVTDDWSLSLPPAQLILNITEGISPYEIVGRIRSRRESWFEIYDSTTNYEFFSVDKVSGVIRTKVRLDYETQPTIILNVNITNLRTGLADGFCQVILNIENVNDNAPVFGRQEDTIKVLETLNVGSILYNAKATDADLDGADIISYFLETNPRNYFKIESSTGQVSLNKALDFERQQFHEIVIRAMDPAQLYSDLKLKIFLLDVNDNAPEFVDSIKEIYLFGDDDSYQQVLHSFKAIDKDSGKNGQVSYALSDTTEHVYIKRYEGTLIQLRPFGKDTHTEINVTVIASDYGLPPLHTKFSFKLMIRANANDINTPSFKGKIQNSTRTIFSKQEPKDKMLKGAETFQIAFFEEPLYNLTFEITFTSLMTIDTCERRSQMSNCIRISEDVNVGSEIGTIYSSISGFLFTLVDIDGEVPSFYVDPLTGNVITTQSLDAEWKSEYHMLIQMDSYKDSFAIYLPRSISINITIEIKKVNDNVPILNNQIVTNKSVNISEDSAIGTSLFKLAAFDKDSSIMHGEIRYDITAQIPSKKFNIDSSGHLKLISHLDYEIERRYLLTVIAYNDRGSKTLQKSSYIEVDIVVTDVNDNAPIFISCNSTNVPASFVGQPFFQVMAIDLDESNTYAITYAIKKGNSNGEFSLQDGFLSLRDILHLPMRHELLIEAKDNGLPPRRSSYWLSVNVTEKLSEDHHFFDSSFQNVSVSESVPANYNIMQFRPKVSKTIFQNVRFSVLKGKETFYIDSDVLKNKIHFDREIQNMHVVVVLVTYQVDQTRRSDMTVIHVHILDENDNSPTFDSQTSEIQIPENSIAGFFHAIIASDLDLEARLSYRIVHGNIGDAFSVERDTGKLFLSSPLDREVIELYSLEIEVSDGRYTTNTSLKIRVLDENDNEPKFEMKNYFKNIPEDIAIGSVILRLRAFDDDVEHLYYHIEPTREDAHSMIAFSIDELTGVVTSTQSFDRESSRGDIYSFNVIAVDSKRNMFTATTHVRVNILDVNDNFPWFDQFPYRISLNSTTLSGSLLLGASDIDHDNAKLSFSIIKRPNFYQLKLVGNLLFISAPNNPQLFSSPGSLETVEVSVSDGSKSSLTVVEIIFNGGPRIGLAFNQSVYKYILPENPPQAKTITQLRAIRSDGKRQPVSYSFVRGNELGAFAINKKTGHISVRDSKLIDFERNPFFNLTVMGKPIELELDDESDLQTAFTNCFIFIQNINDNAPSFSYSIRHVYVYEGLPRYSLVTKVTASDADGKYEALQYEIVGGNIDGAFTMNNGAILTNSVLDREIHEEYKLTISASDMNNGPFLTGTTTIVVRILDKNDNPPFFPTQAPFTIPEGTRAGTLVGSVRAIDSDLYPSLMYRIIDGNNGMFFLSRYSGQLYVLKSLPFNIGPFFIRIEVSDTIHNVPGVIEIHITKNYVESLCQPMFEQHWYKYQLSLNTSYPVTLEKHLTLKNISSQNCRNPIRYKIPTEIEEFVSISPMGSMIIKGEIKAPFLVTAKYKGSFLSDTTVITVSKQNIELDNSLAALKFLDSNLTLTIYAKIPLRKSSPKPLLKVRMNIKDIILQLEDVDDDFRPFLMVDSATGNIYQVRDIQKDEFIPSDMTIQARKKNMNEAWLSKSIKILRHKTLNLKSGIFSTNKIRHILSEDSLLGTTVPICSQQRPRNETNIFETYISGNRENIFRFDRNNFVLKLVKALDFETNSYHFLTLYMNVVGQKDISSSVCRVEIVVTDVNDNEPFFPVQRIFGSVNENTKANFGIMYIPVMDADAGDVVQFLTTSRYFSVDRMSGLVLTKAYLDYELNGHQQSFTVYANDSAGHGAQCTVNIIVKGLDEFAPRFEKRVYRFSLSGLEKPNHVIGQVWANDADDGLDGVVRYNIKHPNKYFYMNPVNGSLMLKSTLDTGVFGDAPRHLKSTVQDIILNVVAQSIYITSSLNSTSLVRISIQTTALHAPPTESNGLAPWAKILLSIILVFILLGAGLFILYRLLNQANHRRNKLNNVESVRASAVTALEMSSSNFNVGGFSRFPPQYSEIVSDYVKTRGHNSDASEKSHTESVSSGRGSVEDDVDDVDVEIRMINEGRNYLSSSSVELSNESAQNTEDYLARLGIDMRKPPNINMASNLQFTNMPNISSAVSETGHLIYNRVVSADETLSEKNSVLKHYASRLNAPDEHRDSLSSSVSYNWDYLLDWGPQYQPLAHVFKEISRLKDDRSTTSVCNTSAQLATTTHHPLALLRRKASQLGSLPSTNVLSHSAISPNFNPSIIQSSSSGCPLNSPLSISITRGNNPLDHRHII